MRIIISLLFLLLPLAASAQQRDSFFDDYEDYALCGQPHYDARFYRAYPSAWWA